MSSNKWCDLCILLLIGISYAVAEENITSGAISEAVKGNCSCGGFDLQEPKLDYSPILSQTPDIQITCDENGTNTCKTLCTALAIATKAKGPEILCNKLQNAHELKLFAFYKACDEAWSFGGMKAEEPLCCDNKVPKICPSMEKVNTTVATNTTVEVKPE